MVSLNIAIDICRIGIRVALLILRGEAALSVRLLAVVRRVVVQLTAAHIDLTGRGRRQR
jgi:hypothetical protein